MMPRRTSTGIILAAFNTPWILLWFYFARGAMDRALGVPALLLLLVLCTIGMIVLPIVLGGVPGRRWLLLIMLGIVNVFWGLQWIGVYARYGPGDAAYGRVPLAMLAAMLVSSTVVVLVYTLLGRLLQR